MRRTLGLSVALGALTCSLAAAQNLPSEQSVRANLQNRPAEPAVKTSLQNLPAEPPVRTLLVSATNEASRLASFSADFSKTVGREQSQAAPRDRNWISRHPVWFGTFIGAGAGAVSAMTMENELFCSGGDEDCFFHGGGRSLVGAGMGAGVGALTGLIVGLASR